MIAFYESNVLELKMIEDAATVERWRENKKPALTPETWVRFGKIYSDDTGSVAADRLVSHHLVRKTHKLEQTQYAMELPPRYIRALIRRIHLSLTVPNGGKYCREETYAATRTYRFLMQSTMYDDTENDWLAPIFNMYSQYGFATAAKISVHIRTSHLSHWSTKDLQKLQVWVMDKLTGHVKTAERLRSGMLKLSFPNKRGAKD